MPDTPIADSAMTDITSDTELKDIDQHELQVGDGTDTHPPRTMDANEDGDELSTPTDDTEQADATRESASYFGYIPPDHPIRPGPERVSAVRSFEQA
jgi:hypothetical protein